MKDFNYYKEAKKQLQIKIRYQNEHFNKHDIEILIDRAPKDALLRILEKHCEVKIWKINEQYKIRELRNYAKLILLNDIEQEKTI